MMSKVLHLVKPSSHTYIRPGFPSMFIMSDSITLIIEVASLL